jgi:hypothetical protein
VVRRSAGIVQGFYRNDRFRHEFMRDRPSARGWACASSTSKTTARRVVLPYDEAVTTIADVVHGGAVSTLVDVGRHSGGVVGRRAHRQPARRDHRPLRSSSCALRRGVDLTAEGACCAAGAASCFCGGRRASPMTRSWLQGELCAYKLGA